MFIDRRRFDMKRTPEERSWIALLRSSLFIRDARVSIISCLTARTPSLEHPKRGGRAPDYFFFSVTRTGSPNSPAGTSSSTV
jgi:hypothetical protein